MRCALAGMTATETSLRGLLSGLPGTVLISIHKAEDVAALCDRIIVLDAGLVHSDGTVPELLATDQPGSRRLGPRFLGDQPPEPLDRLTGAPGGEDGLTGKLCLTIRSANTTAPDVALRHCPTAGRRRGSTSGGPRWIRRRCGPPCAAVEPPPG